MNEIRQLQSKILEIMAFIDSICKANNIDYYIMGGTALGAVRHSGFIPWDDDLDIFMTPENYEKFRRVFLSNNSSSFTLQEWKSNPEFLEFAKVRMNNTTFIEEAFKDMDIHHGIFVDIMILHKCRNSKLSLRKMYAYSKVATVIGLIKRNWSPKIFAHRVVRFTMKLLPLALLSKLVYKYIYKFDDLKENFVYVYFITKAKFRQGLFPVDYFHPPKYIDFDGIKLMCPSKIKEYLSVRYGEYMVIPDENEIDSSIHAIYYDVDKGDWK